MIRQTTPNTGSPIPNATRIHTPQSGQLKTDSKITASAGGSGNPTATASTPAFEGQQTQSFVIPMQSLLSRDNSLVRISQPDFDSDSGDDVRDGQHGLNALDDSYSSSISSNSESKEQIHPHEVRIDINLVGDLPVPGQVIDPPNAPPNQIQNPIAEPHSPILPSTLLGAAVVGTVVAAVSSSEYLPTLLVNTGVGALVGGFAGAAVGCIIDSKMDREAQRIQALQGAPDLEAGEA